LASVGHAHRTSARHRGRYRDARRLMCVDNLKIGQARPIVGDAS
jgi:hypothetical protein